VNSEAVDVASELLIVEKKTVNRERIVTIVVTGGAKHQGALNATNSI